MNTSIPKNIKRLRQKAGITQEQLAENMFVTRQTVSLWENGRTQPDIQTLERLAEVFGVELMIVLYGNAAPRSEEEQRKKALIRWGMILLAGYIPLTVLYLLLWNVIWRPTDHCVIVVERIFRLWLIPIFLTERGIRLWRLWPLEQARLSKGKRQAWRCVKLAAWTYLAVYGLSLFNVIKPPTSGLWLLLWALLYSITWLFLGVGYCVGDAIMKGCKQLNRENFLSSGNKDD